jgi:pimeloyl-ACP methyl ester carboxylesterase/DNA-binding CsgD family transcriptional regulator
MADQKLGFCTTADGVRICYATVGEGPPLVKAPNWLTHLEFEWQSPVWSHWWEELSTFHTLIRFDQRGSGLSDWVVEDLSFDAWVSDLEAVVEAVQLESFILLGISQGGSVAIEFTARHPEMVEKLILFGAYSRGIIKSGQISVEEHDVRLTLVRHGWGRDDPSYRQIFTSGFMPEATAEQAGWFNELQLVSTSPENAARIQETTATIDVLHRLSEITSPTLVLHSVGDRRVPYEQGRQLSSLIPGAKLVDLDSNNHLLIGSEPAWKTCLAAVREFLGTGPPVVAETAADTPAPAPDGLTPREIEVLRLIANGKSNQDIATELVISFNTVTNHVKNILGKTGCANRTEAAAYAIPRGIT